MAINLNTQYPGRTAGTNTNYPYGQGRNVTNQGDGTGTPFESAWFNDVYGFLQALLQGASLTPTGHTRHGSKFAVFADLAVSAGTVCVVFEGEQTRNGRRKYSPDRHTGNHCSGHSVRCGCSCRVECERIF